MENEIKKNSFADAPTEVKPIHGILFVLACLALILCLLMVSVASLVMLGNWGAAFIVLMLQEMFRPVWLVGLILSVALAVRRRNKPRWMWVTSLCSVGTLILMRPSC